MTNPIEAIEFDDIPDDASEITNEPVQYHPLLEVWRALLKPAREVMRDDPITPQ